MQHTPLYDEHRLHGAKVVDFNGWALPVQFSGIVREHEHTRTQASMFDCSHMGEYRVHGRAAIERYGREVTSDVATIPIGRGRYGAILSDDGGILDDLITIRMSEEELYVVTNAGSIAEVTSRLCGGKDAAENVSSDTAKIDIQGPMAQTHVLEAGFDKAAGLNYFNACWTTWRGRDVLLSRTGYTGELGYELFMDNDVAATLWLTFAGMEGLLPAGLGARDTLRTEVGYGLSGQDFDVKVTPLESRMESFIAWDTEFAGKRALEEQRDAADYMVLVGIETDSRRAPRHDYEVRANGVAAGVVTSGTFGPSVGHGVGLARIGAAWAKPGTALSAGPKDLPIRVAEIPFYPRGTCRMKV